MLLAVDLGNTNLTIGLYEGTKLEARWRLATDHERMPDEYGMQILSLLQHSGCSPTQLHGVCMASVVPPLTGRLIQASREYLSQDPLIITHQTNLNIKILIDDPSSAGADRIVDAVAVRQLYGGPACVIDFGTATNFDIIDTDGNYIGGILAPGIGIAAEAMTLRTAKLPRVDLTPPPNVIGKNTIHAMQSGLIFGYVSLVEGLIARIRKEMGNDVKFIATGGLAELIAGQTDQIPIVAPWLTLDGLRIIWDLNHPQDVNRPQDQNPSHEEKKP
ncbi:MAG: type III pantothenate kinase [Chloroflexi bacterium]|nr:type III pantothenate kinase [Chloroflexota bacterium]